MSQEWLKLKNNTNRGESNETEDESYDKTKMRHQMQSMGTEDKSCDAIKMRQEMQPESVVLRGNEETVTTRRGPTKPSQSQETQPVLDSQRPRPNQDQPTWLRYARIILQALTPQNCCIFNLCSGFSNRQTLLIFCDFINLGWF